MIHIKQIDGLRCLAIGLVLATHWGLNTILPAPIPFAPMGVNLFFVISGFLITFILLELKDLKESDGASSVTLLKIFYIRRGLRIFPIYYLSILVCLIFNIKPVFELVGWLLAYSLNIGVSFANVEPGTFGIYWSLAVEEQFYLLFPLLILVFPKGQLPKLFLLMILTAVVSRFIFNNFGFNELREGTISYQFTICCLDTFGFGALLAYQLKNSTDELSLFIEKYFGFSLVLLLLSFLVEFVIESYAGATTLGRFFFSAACFLVIGKAGIKNNFSGVIGKLLENPVIQYLGKISYGIYVYHSFVIDFVHNYVYDSFLRFILKLVLTILIAVISWHFFELPINRLKNKFPYPKNE